MVTRALRIAAAACACAAAALACSAKVTPPPAELVVVVGSDLALPKDMDGLGIQVLRDNAVVYDAELGLGPNGVRVPATVGIVAGASADAQVLVRVIGRKSARTRVLREASVRVPHDRTALLRLALTYWCDGSGSSAATNDQVVSTCPPGDTCIGGYCKPYDVDVGSLATFDARDVFGGAADPIKGTCFDMRACFTGATEVPVDLATCAVPKPPVDGVGVNLAVKLPGGSPDGICFDDQCYVPLDADGEIAWQTTAGSTLVLPPIVCDRLRAGFSLAVVRSTTCATKTVRIPTCGAWSSVGPTVPSVPTTAFSLATDQTGINAVTSYGDYVYWAATAGLRRVARTGGPTFSLADQPTVREPSGVKATPLGLFTVEGVGQRRALRFPLGGGPPTTLLTTSIGFASFAVGGTTLYVPSPNGMRQDLLAVPVDGSSSPHAVNNQVVFGALAATPTTVVGWQGDPALGSLGSIFEASADGRTNDIVVNTKGLVASVAADATYVYWFEEAPGSGGGAFGDLRRIGRASFSSPVTLSANIAQPNAMAIDADYIYIASGGTAQRSYRDGSIVKIAKAGGPLVSVADGEVHPVAIAVDDAAIYWASATPPGESQTVGDLRAKLK